MSSTTIPARVSPAEAKQLLQDGALVTTGVLGGVLVWRPLTAISLFVALRLSFSTFTNTCGMAAVLSKLPCNQAAQCDISHVMNELATDQKA